MRQKILRKSERGQAIILIALAAIGLVAMVGLMVDGGILLIEYGRLKRAIDAASLSAALQYREGYTIQELTNAAQEFLQLNQTDVFDIQIDTDATDSSLLTEPRRKLVRVTASRHVPFGFLPVIGIRQTDITASSVGEAASVDVVIVLDASASMAYEGGGLPGVPDSPADDPSICNLNNTCQPFRQIKDVAIEFVNQLYFPYDRVAIVTFNREAHLILPLDATEGMGGAEAKATVIAALGGLTVFQPPINCPVDIVSASPEPNCLSYNGPGGTYAGLEFPLYRAGGNSDPSSVPSSNSGDGLWLAGAEFGREPIRQDSLWVVIVLSGGPANTGCATGNAHNCSGVTYADGRICPPSTWVSPFCRGADVSSDTRHAAGTLNYDADDYARDAADFLANPLTGQGATIFSIGLGNLIRNSSVGDPLAGEKLLNYAATLAGDESGVLVNHGLYFFAPSAADLREIFRTIAENIATRISQ
jgi:Flp pilus assembly protein TadG